MIAIENIEEKYGKEIAMVILCCRVFIKTATAPELEHFVVQAKPNWQKVYELAKAHRIRPIVYETILPLAEVDAGLKKQLKDFFVSHSLYAFQCRQKAMELTSLMRKRGIAIQLYKGTDLSELLYEHLSIREFGDIDFIVKKEDISALAAILKETGYKMEGEALFAQSPEKYLSHQKDIIYYDNNATGLFLYEFHYKPVGSYLATDLSFKDLLPAGWKIGEKLAICDYLSLLTMNHGLVDLYPTLRCVTDIALLLQKCDGSETLHQSPQLKGYYSLNTYLASQIFGVESSISHFSRQSRTEALARKIIHRLFIRKEIRRVPTSAILKTAFLLREGMAEKLKLIKAVVKYTLTPNYNDTPQTAYKHKWLYILSRPLRLLQHAKRHV